MTTQRDDSTESPVSEPPDQPERTGAPRLQVWTARLIPVLVLVLLFVVAENGWEAYTHHQRLRAVRCDHPVFDFGRAFVGDTIHHTFRVTNVSRHPIQIDKLELSCGCTSVATDLEGTSIPSGEAFDVPVKLEVSAAESGEFGRPVVVRFAGEPPLKLTLKLKGIVEQRWTWSGETVVFDGVRGDRESSTTVVLQRNPQAPAESISYFVTSAPGILRAEFGDAGLTSPPHECPVRLTAVPPLAAGRHEVSVYAYTNGPAIPLTPLRVILIVAE